MRAWVCAALFGVACAAAWAQQAETPEQRAAAEAEAKARLGALRDELRALEAERVAAQGERKDVAAALRAADESLGALARESAELDLDIERKAGELDALSGEESVLAERLDRQRGAVAALLRSTYVLGRHSELKLVFAPEQVGTLARLLAYHRYLQQDRARRIAAITTDLARLAEVRAAIVTTRAELVSARAALAEQERALDAERVQQRAALSALEAALSEKAARAAAIGKDEKALLDLIERLRDAIADIPKVLDGSEPFGTRRGRLPWPVGGTIAARYGSAAADGRIIEGVLIAAKTGTRVSAVSHGRVAYADWLKGYGLLVIVEHGDGYMSLYAHNESLLADVGEWVRAGQPIATVGASGGSATPGVYFELRREGRPVDPAGWLARR